MNGWSTSAQLVHADNASPLKITWMKRLVNRLQPAQNEAGETIHHDMLDLHCSVNKHIKSQVHCFAQSLNATFIVKWYSSDKGYTVT